MKKILYSKNAPEPIGPYSQAIELNNLIFTSGQIALDNNGVLVSEDIKQQTRKTINNIKSILIDNGSSLENVIKTNIYLKNMDDFNAMNDVYSEFFKISLPARSTVQVAKLPKDAKVEIDVIAFR
jgi:2-iminobutanoate/2-iminopropanoate deaminase